MTSQFVGQAYQEGTAVTLDASFYVGSMLEDPTTVTFRVRKPDDTLVSYVYLTDMQVTRISQGVYECALGAPTIPGQYHYDAVGTGAVQATLPGEFYVIASSVVPPDVIPGEPPQAGPCTTWINGEDITQICKVEATVDNIQILDMCAIAASMLLYELSGRKYPGICEQTVRPCAAPCSGWNNLVGFPSQAWGGGWGYNGGLWGWFGGDGSALCGCQPLSQVELPGYPAVAIEEVKIDGAVLAPLDTDSDPTYRLDQWAHLVRLWKPNGANPQPRFWPSCQNLSLDDDQPGTFSVAYTYGVTPPLPGIMAAEQLACELYKAYNGQPCALPSGTTEVTRQGIRVQRLLTSWNLQLSRFGLNPGSYMTGMPLVDSFLSAFNPYGKRRRSVAWSPDLQQPARRLGSS